MNSSAPKRDVLLLLMMCPLLAVSDTVVNAIGGGLAVLIAAPVAAALFMLARRWLTPETHLAGALLLLGGATACIELLMRAYFYDLHGSLGVFLPLIVANIVVVGALIEPEQTIAGGVSSTLRTSAAIALTLLILGVARELVGRGSLLHDAGLMFGQWARVFDTGVFRIDRGFLLGMLPPGAFISLGLLLAVRNWQAARRDGMA
jgi:Na+-translocating ferredoxin:NAD+ oxidoreductase subunit E